MKTMTQPDVSGTQFPKHRSPNIIFILCDDLGWGDLACYGHTLIKTPNIDRLAREGTLFTQFYSASPVCSPSRAAFMTGQFPAKLRVHDYLPVPLLPHQVKAGTAQFMDVNVPTVARALQQAGYATAHFGKWHLGDGPDAPDVKDYGFDRVRVTHGRGPSFGEWWTDPTFRPRCSELLVDEAIQFVEDCVSGTLLCSVPETTGGPVPETTARPFFINLWLLDPHATLNPTAEQMAPYEHLMPQGVKYPGAMAVYYSVVTNLDAQIGRLMAKLDELGLAEDTLVIFSSDNGPEDICIPGSSHSAAGDTPFRGRKRSLYDGGVRMPFIARWPGQVPAGQVSESVISAVDFLPTMCNLAGCGSSLNAELDGEDVSDILFGAGRARTKPLFWDFRFRQAGSLIHHSPQLAMLDGKWKLLMNRDGSRVELYDVSDNRMEVDNLADQEPGRVAQMSARLIEWADTLPPGDPVDGAGILLYDWPEEAK
jgi:arylsulfatase A-like enzyme